MRGGFLARTGFVIGQVSVSHGLGGLGTIPIENVVPTSTEQLVPGAHGPRLVPENKRAPSVLLNRSIAKRKRGP